jgi:hypothetical protein
MTLSTATMMLSRAFSRSVRGAYFSGLSCMSASRYWHHDGELPTKVQEGVRQLTDGPGVLHPQS